ncbi:MAG: oxidoreductase [Candidatus Melainabacteria bacterium]|nr:oxidoreductase [Candidatus Melainabacteria bacterium]
MDHSRQSLPCIAIHSLTGCAGELLVILENLDKILPFVQVVSFPFAQSKNEMRPVDIALVEGSVSQPHDLEKLRAIRSSARWLVAVGNCAVWGCVQKSACRIWSPEQMVAAIYGEGSPIEALPSQPLDSHVRVDVKLSGCPINATQLLSVMASLLKDHLPYITHKCVCLECKLKENCCVLIEKNLPCLGPITAAGCGALCPSFGAACYGCWGPCEAPQMEAMATILSEKGYQTKEILGRLAAFGIPDELLSQASSAWAKV